MAAKITERIVSQGHGSLGRPRYIVIHETANPGATAQNHVDYWSREDDYAVHAVCDWDRIFHTVPYDRLCWHVGNANGFTIGIEICHATNRADFERAWSNAVAWTKAMMKRFGLPASRVVSHDYCSRTWGGSDHDDPIGYFKKYGRTWNDFIRALGGKTPAAQSTTAKTSSGDFEGGRYRCTVSKLWVRSKPSLKGAKVASYRKGQTVNLDDWYTVADGYVWGRYTSYSGHTRYIAVGKHTGRPESNDYLVKA